MHAWLGDLTTLQQALSGRIFTEETPGYEAEIAVFNLVVTHRPGLVVGASNATDVTAAVKFASRHGLKVAVLNTGHGPSLPADADTLMITTRRMSNIDIDAATRTARVQA